MDSRVNSTNTVEVDLRIAVQYQCRVISVSVKSVTLMTSAHIVVTSYSVPSVIFKKVKFSAVKLVIITIILDEEEEADHKVVV